MKKDTNPKDAIGIRKGRCWGAIPALVIKEVGVGMMEGAFKYGRHNYRIAGIRASVYYDAARNHMDDWWEGEDIDADSGLSHVTKAICSLVVLRDAMINEMWTDDRPPSVDVATHREEMQRIVDAIFDRYPEPLPAYVKGDNE